MSKTVKTERNIIADAFFECVSEFSRSTNARDLKSSLLYAGDGKTRDGMVSVADYGTYLIEYSYTVSSRYMRAPSVFNIRVIFDTAEKVVKYPLYDLMYMLEPGNFKCYRFSYIDTPETMKKCFLSIRDDLERFLPRIERIARETRAREDVQNKFFERLSTFSGREVRPHPLSEDMFDREAFKDQLDMFLLWSDARFDTAAYADFLSGKYRSSIKKYGKFKNKSMYEMRLISFMESLPSAQTYPAVAEGCNTIGYFSGAKSSLVELLQFFVGWFVMMVPCIALSLGLYYLFAFAVAHGAQFATQYSFSSATSAILPGMFCAIAFAPYAGTLGLYLLPKKSRSRAKKFDATKKLRRTGCFRFFSHATVAVALAVILAFAGSGVVFLDAGMRVRNNGFEFSGQYVAYSDVEYASTYEGYYDVYGSWVESPSLILVLKNGDMVDLHYSVSESRIESKVLPIIIEKDIELRHIRDLGIITKE